MTDTAQSSEEHRLKLRNLRPGDYPDMKAVMDRIYAGPLGGSWTREQFLSQLARFPEGQICIEDNGRVVGAAMSLIVDYDQYGDQHTYAEITADGNFTTHDPDGDVLYGAEVFVDPDATCAALEGAGVPTEAVNLNYPSIGVSQLAGERMGHRTVTRLANRPATSWPPTDLWTEPSAKPPNGLRSTHDDL